MVSSRCRAPCWTSSPIHPGDTTSWKSIITVHRSAPPRSGHRGPPQLQTRPLRLAAGRPEGPHDGRRPPRLARIPEAPGSLIHLQPSSRGRRPWRSRKGGRYRGSLDCRVGLRPPRNDKQGLFLHPVRASCIQVRPPKRPSPDVRSELVEGRPASELGPGFDRLSPNGIASPLPALSPEGRGFRSAHQSAPSPSGRGSG